MSCYIIVWSHLALRRLILMCEIKMLSLVKLSYVKMLSNVNSMLSFEKVTTNTFSMQTIVGILGARNMVNFFRIFHTGNMESVLICVTVQTETWR